MGYNRINTGKHYSEINESTKQKMDAHVDHVISKNQNVNMVKLSKEIYKNKTQREEMIADITSDYLTVMTMVKILNLNFDDLLVQTLDTLKKQQEDSQQG